MTTRKRSGRASFRPHPESTIELPLADSELTLGKSLLWSAERYGDREACVYEGGRWTYREVLADAEHCARSLIALGVDKGTRVAVLMGARYEFISLVYGAAMAGAVCVLISTFSTDDELDYVLAHSGASLLFTHASVRGRHVAADLAHRHPQLTGFPKLQRIFVVPDKESEPAPFDSWNDFTALAEAGSPEVMDQRREEIAPDDDAMLLYTSGSTARPKAVLHMHRAPTMQGFRMADAMAIGSEDRSFTSFPPFWTAGWLTAAAAPFAVGACSVLQEFYDPAEALDLIASERVTSLRQMIHDEMRLVAANSARPHDLRSVTVGTVTEALAALTSVDYEISEICGWGMTETFALAAMLQFDEPAELRRTTMGRVVPGNRIRIRDVDTGEEMPAGEMGEITVAGMSLMRGYLNGESALAEPTLPLDDAGYLPTNDAGYMRPDGYLVFTGRLDRLIKSAGVNVSPIEIEEHVQRWGRLGTCLVIGLPHPTLGQAVVLCALQKPGAVDSAVSPAEVIGHLRETLAAYKVPREVLFFEEHEVALTVSSKVQADQMTALAIARLLDSDIDPEWRQLLEAHKA
jgi:fatty-acyl-CoA synthase